MSVAVEIGEVAIVDVSFEEGEEDQGVVLMEEHVTTVRKLDTLSSSAE